jgi:hypothetical protein
MATNLVFSDFDPDMIKQNDGDIKRDVEEESVKNSLKNIVLTLQGSRRMLPEFSTEIHKLLFEPIDENTARQIADQIVGSIELWDDRVDILDFIIQPFSGISQYKCSMVFQIKGTSRTETLKFVLK